MEKLLYWADIYCVCLFSCIFILLGPVCILPYL